MTAPRREAKRGEMILYPLTKTENHRISIALSADLRRGPQGNAVARHGGEPHQIQKIPTCETTTF